MTKHRKTNYLLDVLTYAASLRRPHGGKGVETLARYIERQFPGRTFRDGAGNIHLDARTLLRGKPVQRTLFVAHIDTVHRSDGPNRLDASEPGWLKATKDCLGADDAAGVAILCYLAKFGVPAYYIFTQGEERGGIGATFLADHMPDLLRQFDRAIAFDRRDVWSVITHQGWSGRCASDAFGEALADALNAQGLLYAPDSGGVYTDTAEFTSFIPECTNLSVGYYNEHSVKERLDLNHFVALAKAARKIDWESLPTKRDPKVIVSWKTGYGVEVNLDASISEKAQDPKFLTWEYTDYDLEMIDCLELAERGRPDALCDFLAKRMGANKIDRSIAKSALLKKRITNKQINDTFDTLDAQGAEIAADILIEDLIGSFH